MRTTGNQVPTVETTKVNPVNQHLICRCEEITDDEVGRAIHVGARTVNDVKRHTRAGMGVCQGIYCVAEIAKALGTLAGITPGEAGPLTARPPVRLLVLGALAGREPDDPLATPQQEAGRRRKPG
ncbi:MAG: hypothetical protein QOF33_1889 [Thermomicrobiales bacterium]|jgi:bacterioferritin-associated ferredoxin|nr:hypothetical protein [Thermomicrobiales bacterium]